jgi:putative PIN family toxin of toxin-antitoxin system
MSVTPKRVMFDTNIIISAILNPLGNPSTALLKGAEFPYTLVLCDQIVDEIRRIFNRKFPFRVLDMELFLARLRYDMVSLSAEDEASPDEGEIRDVKDRPILRAARKASIDILVTGDKDFTESTVTQPTIMTATQFLGRG